jgi:transcription antitermination factor NusG
VIDWRCTSSSSSGSRPNAPRLRDRRIIRGRRVVQNPLLFPGYLFCLIELQWSQARFSPGVVRLVMDGVVPATVPDTVISSLKAREIGGLIELPKPPRFRRGDHVRVLRGPFAGHVGLYAGMKPRDRVAVLLTLFGGSRCAELTGEDVARWP